MVASSLLASVANSQSAITAIRSIKAESSVATTIGKIGWSLVGRATDSEGLQILARDHPGALIIASHDFPAESLHLSNPLIRIDRNQELTDTYIQELLRTSTDDSATRQETPMPCRSEVTLVTSVNGGNGCSTFAINIAHEKSRFGSKVLLLDFNARNPSISRYFEIQRINRRISPTPFGFAIGEVSELATFAEIAEEANGYDQVVIDLGKFPDSEFLLFGIRIHEVLARWSIQSASHVFLLARSDGDTFNQLKRISSDLEQEANSLPTTIFLISHLRLSGGEKRAIDLKARQLTGKEVRHLPWEPRLVERARAERAPISEISRKSLLAQEVSAISAPSKSSKWSKSGKL